MRVDIKRIALFSLAATMAFPVLAEPSTQTYAQALIDREVAAHPELLTLVMHVTPPKSSENIIIAANKKERLGQKADPDDLEVINTGKPLKEVNEAGDRFEVQVRLQDASKRTVGGLEMAFPYKKGDDKAKLYKTAQMIQSELARRISHVANLLEPAQADTKTPTNTYAQFLLDEMLDKHPDVIIAAFHVTPPNSADNVIVASNIGRIGKKGDEDDMNVIKTGEPKLEINTEGDRFESEQTLQDVSGDTIGAVGIVFPYKKGDDKAALHKKATKIRDELRRKVLNVNNLMDPFPFDQSAPLPLNTYAQKLVDQQMAKHPDLEILCIHASPPHGSYPIIGSSIGRIGKKADEDDMRVIETGKPNLEVSSNGKRFETELVMQDVSGKTIGALGVVMPYKAGDDQAALQKRAEAIRDGLRKQTPSVEKLYTLVK